ncbi:hypothetical protein HDU96_009004 [Phlyctochytrium bullatum]|nr:hypothetical protein HDU96_009004 [Phlyctochytrium bullatum]
MLFAKQAIAASLAVIAIWTTPSSVVEAKKCKPKNSSSSSAASSTLRPVGTATNVASSTTTHVPFVFPTYSSLPIPKPYDVIPKPPPSSSGSQVPPEVEKVNPAKIVDGKEKAPEGCKPAEQVPVESPCMTDTTFVYKYTSTVILKGGAHGDHTSNVTCDALVTCLGPSPKVVDAFVYDLQISNLEILTQAHTDDAADVAASSINITRIDDAKVAKPFRYVRDANGKVLNVEVSPDEQEDYKAIKKGITESFSTYLKYKDGKATVLETGVSSERTAEYRAVTYRDHVAIEARYDSDSIRRYAPGSTAAKDNAQYKAHTNCVVDKNGIVLSSYDRTHVMPGDEAGFTDDDENGPDMRIHASADCVLVGKRQPAVEVPKTSGLNDEPLLSKAPESETPAKQRRSASEAIEEAGHLVRRLAKNPEHAELSHRLSRLARDSPDAAAHILDLARRHLSPVASSSTGLARRASGSAANDRAPAPALLSALAASTLEDAHLHLVELSADPAHPHRGLARAALTFAVEPTAEVVARVANLTTAASTSPESRSHLLALGALLASRPEPEAVQTMQPHVDAAFPVTPATLDHARHVILGVGNMGARSAFALDTLAAAARNPALPADLRAEAVRALRDAAHLPSVRQALADILDAETLPDDAEETNHHVRIAVVEVAAGALTKNRSVRRSRVADVLDHSILRAYASASSGPGYTSDLEDAFAAWYRARTGLKEGQQASSSQHLVRRQGSAWKLYTSNRWNATDSSTFDLVLPYGERQQDVLDFPVYGSGLAGVMLGWDKLNLQVAGGGFGGLGKQGCLVPEFKAFTRARATGQVFGRGAELLDARIQVVHRISPPLAQAEFSLVLMGKSVLAQDYQFTCKTWVFPITNLDFTVVDFSYDIPIYIAAISVRVNLMGNFRAQVEATVCAEPSAKVSFKPTVTTTLRGSGGVTIIAVRGAIAVGGTLSYTIGPEVRALVPSDGCKVCISLNHAWDPAQVKVSALVEGWLFKWRKVAEWDLFKFSFGGREWAPVHPAVNYCVDPSTWFPKPKPSTALPSATVGKLTTSTTTTVKPTTTTTITTSSKSTTTTTTTTSSSSLTTTTAKPTTTSTTTTSKSTSTSTSSSSTTLTTTTAKPTTTSSSSSSTATTTTKSSTTTTTTTTTTTSTTTTTTKSTTTTTSTTERYEEPTSTTSTTSTTTTTTSTTTAKPTSTVAPPAPTTTTEDEGYY